MFYDHLSIFYTLLLRAIPCVFIRSMHLELHITTIFVSLTCIWARIGSCCHVLDQTQDLSPEIPREKVLFSRR